MKLYLKQNKNLDNTEDLVKYIKDVLESIINNSKDKTVYILGHINPDCDSIFSAYILSEVLKSPKELLISCKEVVN